MKKFLIPTCQNAAFAELTTLGCGGKIKLVIYPDTVKKLRLAIKYLDGQKIPYFVLGRGSNTLASDDEFDGVVVSTSEMKKVKIKGRSVCAEAGTSTVTLSKELQTRGLAGGEFLACLPASVGGALVCNAGCFGQDMASVAQSVTVLHRGKIRKISKCSCGFGKRQSLFKNNSDYVVLGVKFLFEQGSAEEIAARICEMREKKAATQPLNYRSAGCALYHDKVSVSRLMDEAGLKGYAVGGAKISEKHAGFIVNVDKARSKDIYLIIEHARDALASRYGICAKVEVCLFNFTKDEQNDVFTGSKK